MNLESFLDRYPDGPKSCLYCKHFKTKIPTMNVKTIKGKTVNEKRILLSKMKPASCKEGLLLREKEDHGELYEPTYPINKLFWKRIDDGFLHHDWRFANRCPSFTDMRDEFEVMDVWIEEVGKIDKNVFDDLKNYIKR